MASALEADDLSTCAQLEEIHFLDATPMEETVVPSKLLLVFNSRGNVVGSRLLGEGEVGLSLMKELVKVRLLDGSNACHPLSPLPMCV